MSIYKKTKSIKSKMCSLSRTTYLVICVFVYINIVNAGTQTKVFFVQDSKFIKSINQIDHFISTQDDYKKEGFNDLLTLNNNALKLGSDPITIFKNLAIINAELKNPKKAYVYTNKYINASLDFSILQNDSFKNIQDSNEYKLLNDKYLFKIDFLSFICFYIALIGFFLVVVLNLKKRVDKLANILISGFVLTHVLFIIEYALCVTNIQYKYPHSYLISSSLALMYGPLLYFYFKRVTQGYEFKKIDLLHFLPTIFLLLIILRPIYLLSAEDKIRLMLGINMDYKHFWLDIFLSKLISLLIYGMLIGKLHFAKIKKNQKNDIEKDNIIWEKNIFRIYVVYVFSYLIYGLSISLLGEAASIIYNTHIITMSSMIIYVAYMAYAQPKLFSERISHRYKYEKSGLTDSLSKELSENLFKLLIEDKIYKDSDISLETLSTKLGTTRHNTSQIINEHYNMNFFELINKFRIEEALNILKSDNNGNLHIIDVAYEVGFNNKVTFNKAFKKQMAQTPSEFVASNFKNIQTVNWR